MAAEDDIELRIVQVSTGDMGERNLDRIVVVNVWAKTEGGVYSFQVEGY